VRPLICITGILPENTKRRTASDFFIIFPVHFRGISVATLAQRPSWGGVLLISRWISQDLPLRDVMHDFVLRVDVDAGSVAEEAAKVFHIHLGIAVDELLGECLQAAGFDGEDGFVLCHRRAKDLSILRLVPSASIQR